MSTLESKSAAPWNKGKLVGQKLPLKLKEIWAIRVRLQLASNRRNLTLLNLAIDRKLRESDLVKMKVSDISNAGVVSARAMVLQQKTGRPVQFEITEQTREAISEWMTYAKLSNASYLFLTRLAASKHLSTRQYARIVESWVTQIGLDSSACGKHSMRRATPQTCRSLISKAAYLESLLSATSRRSPCCSISRVFSEPRLDEHLGPRTMPQ